MPLASGTALQDGHYIIDALLEDAPNGALYWGTHIPTGMSVYLQVLTPGTTPLGDTVQRRLQSLAFAPRPPLPQPLQTFAEGDTHYLAMGTALGQPWSQLCRHRSPASPKVALALTRHTAEGVQWLLTQGLPSVDLSPNRIWLPTDGLPVILTGLTSSALPTPTQELATLAHPLRGLAALLYSLLMGQLPELEHLAQCSQTLGQQQPTLSPLIIQAVQAGLGNLSPEAMSSTHQALADQIGAWLQTLPDSLNPVAVTVGATAAAVRSTVGTDAPAAPTAAFPPEAKGAGPDLALPDPSSDLSSTSAEVSATVAVAPLPQPNASLQQKNPQQKPRWSKTSPKGPSRSSHRRLSIALLGTALVAAVGGVAAGAAWRLTPSGLPGQVRLDPDQSFPSRSDWSGDRLDATFESPFLPEGDGIRPPISDPAWNRPPTSDDWPSSDFGSPTDSQNWDADFNSPAPPLTPRSTPVETDNTAPPEVNQPRNPMPEPMQPEVAPPPPIAPAPIPENVPAPAPAPSSE
ncbi:hypothetical protein [Leptolyngbya sp. PCC 6406]|uniref:hypothetical protein n=1 Tax=Leptolyngbya sp. PCC 6406 TaxID=1173264 RepID=UPI0002AC840F|nr:hypothetical protein [Leptolyngbya sp. PCC 6406]